MIEDSRQQREKQRETVPPEKPRDALPSGEQGDTSTSEPTIKELSAMHQKRDAEKLLDLYRQIGSSPDTEAEALERKELQRMRALLVAELRSTSMLEGDALTSYKEFCERIWNRSKGYSTLTQRVAAHEEIAALLEDGRRPDLAFEELNSARTIIDNDAKRLADKPTKEAKALGTLIDNEQDRLDNEIDKELAV